MRTLNGATTNTDQHKVVSHDNDRTINRTLRIGYVSPDIREHSVAYFLEAVLDHHDRAFFRFLLFKCGFTRP